MVPYSIVNCIIVVQCLINLLGIWLMSYENKGKDEVIENLSKKLMEKDEVIANLSKKLGGR